MTCREALNLVPLLLDGELESRQMRALVMHSTRCAPCEAELRQLEHLQGLLNESVNARVDELDLGNFWPRIEQRLGTCDVSVWQRLRAWWNDGERRWMVQLPAFAAAAVLVALAMAFFLRNPQAPLDPGAQVATNDNTATIEQLDTDADSVAVVNDPETRTTALWLVDEALPGEAP
jgi:hypothetical protein